MKWRTYLVIDELKLMLEVPDSMGHVSIKLFEKEFNRLERLLEEIPGTALDENILNVSLKDLGKYLSVADSINNIHAISICNMLPYFLMISLSKLYNLKVRLLTDDIDEFKQLKKTYKIIKFK